LKKRFLHILALVQKDLLLEIRKQYSFYGIVLYVAATVFMIYLTIPQPPATVWNGLFWTIQLFVCVNAVAKSFLQESKGRMLYFYSISSPIEFILAKFIFNVLLMLCMNLLTLGICLLLLGNPIEYLFRFAAISCLGSIGLSMVFTFLAAIAAKAEQSAALMAIMGFPVIVPQLLLLSKSASVAFATIVQGGLWQMILLLLGFDVMIIVLGIILFPFLWKD
jgi:heme exporter protein B